MQILSLLFKNNALSSQQHFGGAKEATYMYVDQMRVFAHLWIKKL